MSKKLLLLIGALSAASTAWAVLGDPYIGQTGIPNDWSTSSKVTATSGSQTPASAGWDVSQTTPLFTVNGAGVLNFAGATPPDGQLHTPSVVGYCWYGNAVTPTGLVNPAGRPTNMGNGMYSQNWIAFTFDQPYDVKDIDIWNGGYATGVGGGADYSLKDVYIDYKVNGVWQMAASTIQLNRCPDNGGSWFANTDNIAVGLNGVEEVVITPISSWAEIEGGYWTPNAVMSEIRFYTVVPEPSTLALLGLGALGLFLRRKR